MKLNDLDVVHLGAAQLLAVHQAERGWRRAIAALNARLVKAWIGLYAPPPRRLGPLV
jgi:hypothetical protein